jgi:hypothetical protein
MLGAAFEVRRVEIDDQDRTCIIWYEPDYDIFQGAVLADETVRVVQFVNCKEYSDNFIARPSLAGLCFGTVSRLYGLLVLNTSWRSQYSSTYTTFLEAMAQRLEKLRQHWKERGFHKEGVAETESPKAS